MRLKQNLDVARQLRMAGVPLWIEEDDREKSRSRPSDVIVSQIDGKTKSRIFDLPGVAGLILSVRFIPNIKGPFAIDRFDLRLPWHHRPVDWLFDPGEPCVYSFSSTPDIEYERSRVLNHLAGTGRIFRNGRPIQGLLLGFSSCHVPESEWGKLVQAKFTITDQFGREHPSVISLWAQRRKDSAETIRALRRRVIDHDDDRPISVA